nr:MAG TPA: hypothetical protein [Caudoviricetes sp.]
MDKLKIIFSNGEVLTLKEHDLITPIVLHEQNGEQFPTMSKLNELWVHTHDGLIPSLMESLYLCRFFYVNENHNIVYGAHSIVKIEVC